jgi:hypothetical protein
LTNVLHAIILGIVQGLTELLPISSSAHLYAIPELFNWGSIGDFDVALHAGTLLTIGVSFAGLLVNAKTKKVTTVSGLLPKSIWYRKKLTAPSALKGEVTVNHKDVSNYTIMKCLKDESSFYDSKSGWLCIGNRKLVKNTTNVQIMENVILVFENNELKSLWINLGVNL